MKKSLIVLTLLLIPLVLAANNPGHDSLYIEQNGNSELAGSLNITQELKVANLFYSSYLDILGNGSQPTGSYAQIYTPGNNLVLNAPQSIYLAKDSGSTVYIGGTSVNLNVSGNTYVTGNLYQDGVAVCLANGTNCINGNNTGNVSSVTAGSGLTDTGTTSNPVLNVGAGAGITVNADDVAIDPAYTQRRVSGTCSAGEAIRSINQDGTVTCQSTSGASTAGGWTNTSTTTSTSLDVNVTSGDLTVPNGRIGIGTNSPATSLEVMGNISLPGAYKLSFSNGANPATEFSGLSRISSSADLDISSLRSIKVYLDTDNSNGDTTDYFALYENTPVGSSTTPVLYARGDGNVGIGTATPGEKLEVAGRINASTDVCITGALCLSQAGTGGGDVTDVLAGTGINVTNSAGPQPTVSINTTWLDANYVGQNEYPNLDTDNTDDLTTSTTFNGDVSGAYNNLQLTTDVVGDNELNYSQVTLNDFTNDAGFLTTESQNLSDVLAQGNNAGSYNIDMNNQLITNIGNAGTDFTSSGLTLAGTLTVNGAGTHTIAGDTNFDSNTLFINSTNHNVGIGTNSPSYALDVVGDVNIREADAYRIGGVTAVRLNRTINSLIIGDTTANPSASGIVAVGKNAGAGATGSSFAAEGYQAGYNAGGYFAAQGYNAGYQAGSNFAAQGYYAGKGAGSNFAAQGYHAGDGAGSNFTAQGYNAGSYAGSYFAAQGYDAGNSAGNNFIAIGYEAANGAGDRFIAIGYRSTDTKSLSSPTGINDSIAIGYQSDPRYDGHFLIKQANLNTIPLIQGDLTSGKVAIGTSTATSANDFNAQLEVESQSSTTKGLIVKGATSQSANLQEWQNSSGDALVVVNSSGNVRIGTGTPGNATGAGDLYVTSDIEYDGNLYGPGADLAERTPSEAGLAAGMVVELDPEHPGSVRKSTHAYSTLVAGVVSTEPGIILGKNEKGVELAVTGRVPVRVNDENGPIEVGDLLTTSSVPGEAMACRSAEKCFGAILGKAMEPLREKEGTITALVTLG